MPTLNFLIYKLILEKQYKNEGLFRKIHTPEAVWSACLQADPKEMILVSR
jgi:hypothetical protein